MNLSRLYGGCNCVELSDEEKTLKKVPRKRKRTCYCDSFVTIRHEIGTTIAEVGKQLWQASFLLVNYLIDKHRDFADKVIFELGAGVGFVGTILSMLHTEGYFLTDVEEVLDYTRTNIENNKHLMTGNRNNVRIRVFDWRYGRLNFDNSSLWSSDDKAYIEERKILFIAADVIYDDELTDMLFQSMAEIMNPQDLFVVSVDKRFNFSIDKLDLVAHGYENFLEIIGSKNPCIRTFTIGNQQQRQFRGRKVDVDSCSSYISPSSSKSCGETTQIDEDTLEIWEVAISFVTVDK